ncbi:hypothetical protein [Pseudomonas aeruginosa]|uniref:hypothetical protein n=1 Tax=Pseudomonas aeruginosa TaxID=287 RepID=UPI001043BC18|nr:hypothetical protein [Pseudomonas aeruginosa]MCO3747566.1 hypothetical protein [Pseudomonas aeruginosa]MCV6454912.1 hypothetical protein [Pseudomonas aeruginosa]HCF0591764.1 hypothetical protein [Pseudomonas aeruginosa]
MLHLVTDQLDGEPNILSPVLHEAFEIRSLSGQVIKSVQAPELGWTHEQLMAVAMAHDEHTREGADGYLGGHWVGSTEV